MHWLCCLQTGHNEKIGWKAKVCSSTRNNFTRWGQRPLGNMSSLKLLTSRGFRNTMCFNLLCNGCHQNLKKLHVFRNVGSVKTVSAPKHQNQLHRAISSLHFSANLFSVGLLNTTFWFCRCLHLRSVTRQMFFPFLLDHKNGQTLSSHCQIDNCLVMQAMSEPDCATTGMFVVVTIRICREDWAKEAVAKAKLIGGDMSLWRRLVPVCESLSLTRSCLNKQIIGYLNLSLGGCCQSCPATEYLCYCWQAIMRKQFRILTTIRTVARTVLCHAVLLY